MEREKLISEIVTNVIASMEKSGKRCALKQKGVFDTMEEALSAVDKAYKEYK